MRNLHLRVTILFLILLLANACSIRKDPSAGEVASDGNAVHYEVHGRGDQTLLLVHGWSNTLHVWDQQIQHFSQKYRVVAVDLPGYGASKNNRNSWAMADFGKDVAAVITHLKLDQVILVGFSMGGPVSIETARRLPEKIKGIVLVDILQNPDGTYTDDMIQNITTTYMDAVTHPTAEKVKPFFKTRTAELSQKYIAMVKEAPKTGWSDSLENCLVWLSQSAVTSIKSLNIPILAINADQYPTDAEAFRKYNPAFKARIIKDVYHCVFWESPDTFNQYLEESIQDIQKASTGS